MMNDNESIFGIDNKYSCNSQAIVRTARTALSIEQTPDSE